MAYINLQAKISVASFLVVSSFLVVTVGLALPTNHDEFQYIAAAALARSGSVYKDFFYSQTPYFPVALSWIYGLVAPDHLLVASRMFNVLWSLTFVAALLAVHLRVARHALFAVGLSTVVLLCPLLDLPLRTARNDMMPLALATLALAVVVYSTGSDSQKVRSAGYLVTGILLSAAVCTKQSYAFVALAFAIHALIPLRTSFIDQVRTTAFPQAFGGLAAALPAVWIASQQLENFVYSIGEFHQTLHLAFRGEETPSFVDRSRIVLDVLIDPALLLLGALGAGLLAIQGFKLTRALLTHEIARTLLLTLLAAFAVTVSLFFANPLHKQYAAPLLPFLSTFVAALYNWCITSSRESFIRQRVLRSLGVALIPLAILSSLGLSSRGMLPHLWRLSQHRYTAESTEAPWSRGEKVFIMEHANAVRAQMHRVLGEQNRSLRIATLMPSYPLDAGYGIYAELSGPPFFYRANDHLSSEQRRQLRGISPTTSAAWLNSVRAEAVLVGYDPRLEVQFLEYAISKNFKCYRIDLEGAHMARVARLYVSPILTHSPPSC
jgi:hypothetical protein